MRLPLMLLMGALLLASGLARAHEGHVPKPKPPEKDSAGKPAPPPGRTALAEADISQRFCMKNKEGRVHCIPFGPH
jgi:hypothetical protein